MFGSGTACIISPISVINFVEENLFIPTMEQPSPVYKMFLKRLSEIQYGYVQNHPWAFPID